MVIDMEQPYYMALKNAQTYEEIIRSASVDLAREELIRQGMKHKISHFFAPTIGFSRSGRLYRKRTERAEKASRHAQKQLFDEIDLR